MLLWVSLFESGFVSSVLMCAGSFVVSGLCCSSVMVLSIVIVWLWMLR